SNDGFVVGMD
ncbi:hypothetical protein D047_0944B, partial [Vibrio parahaemolyticus VPTS-2010_2]